MIKERYNLDVNPKFKRDLGNVMRDLENVDANYLPRKEDLGILAGDEFIAYVPFVMGRTRKESHYFGLFEKFMGLFAKIYIKTAGKEERRSK